eukprot:3280732-Rhodomonas_salina.1
MLLRLHYVVSGTDIAMLLPGEGISRSPEPRGGGREREGGGGREREETAEERRRRKERWHFRYHPTRDTRYCPTKFFLLPHEISASSYEITRMLIRGTDIILRDACIVLRYPISS